jgi:hypothetical protein
VASPGFDDRRLSFGAAAADYAAHRPTYPVEAVRWALGAATRPVREVADVGAGTGAFSRVLAALGLVALEYFLALRYLPKVTLLSLVVLIAVARSSQGPTGRYGAFAVAVLLAPVLAAIAFWTLGALWRALFGPRKSE